MSKRLSIVAGLVMAAIFALTPDTLPAVSRSKTFTVTAEAKTIKIKGFSALCFRYENRNASYLSIRGDYKRKTTLYLYNAKTGRPLKKMQKLSTVEQNKDNIALCFIDAEGLKKSEVKALGNKINNIKTKKQFITGFCAGAEFQTAKDRSEKLAIVKKYINDEYTPGKKLYARLEQELTEGYGNLDGGYRYETE